MKTSLFLMKIAAIAGLAAAIGPVAFADDGGATSGGGDRVEVLFLQAKQDASAKIGSLKLSDLPQLMIPQVYKNWLEETGRLYTLQYYTEKMELQFSEGACMEGANPRSTSFDNSNPEHPVMCVSRMLNVATEPTQAMALVFHEAGHFAGEVNHLFLSDLGNQLARMSKPAAPVLPAVPCTQAGLNLAEVQIGFRCKTQLGAVYERVDSLRGFTWKTEDGIVISRPYFGSPQENQTFSDGQKTCMSNGVDYFGSGGALYDDDSSLLKELCAMGFFREILLPQGDSFYFGSRYYGEAHVRFFDSKTGDEGMAWSKGRLRPVVCVSK